MTGPREPWTLIHGASWLTLEGQVFVVPGFHEEWIRDHPELVGGCRSVSEVVLRKSWISMAVYSEGYVELLVPRRGDAEVRRRVETLLARNRGLWKRVLVMSMDEEGYSTILPGDLDSQGRLEINLSGPGNLL
jgi:hypothetical protein